MHEKTFRLSSRTPQIPCSCIMCCPGVRDYIRIEIENKSLVVGVIPHLNSCKICSNTIGHECTVIKYDKKHNVLLRVKI